jgi:pimeloyl-ACP methyl ester carboxylesterase
MSIYSTAMAELPPCSDRDIATSLGTVRAYRFDGPAGSPVLLLPGRNASTPMWRVNIAPLMQHRTVIAMDLLGEALAGLGLDRVHLMGVSIGGWTATNREGGDFLG